ncbi:MAG: hypothetical protein SOX74_04120, partial [Candidatus Faecousia sp.]|uniref:hypothetical protein n=1 Tax=Faecousia sp. TaxID=2952921 RepID=UPI002A8874E6|nr:hypothetical protein [Candidatus Faecousia sp.]
VFLQPTIRRLFITELTHKEPLNQSEAALSGACNFIRGSLESVKKLEELFIAPTARQILHETAQRACARCECV